MLVKIILLLVAIFIVVTLYCCCVVAGRSNAQDEILEFESKINAFKTITLEELIELHNKHQLVAVISNGVLVGFSQEG